MDKEKLKSQITQEFIKNTLFDGWNDKTLKNSIKSLNIESGYEEILFPEGVKTLTAEIGKYCNDKAFDKFSKLNIGDLRISEKVEEILFIKIKEYHLYFGNFEVLKKFCAHCMEPQNLTNTSKNIFNFSDQVWNLLDDNSTDFSYYTKRASLGSIYSKAVIYSLSDESENLTNTKFFLKRTIDGLMKFHKLKSKFFSLLPDPKFLFKNRA